VLEKMSGGTVIGVGEPEPDFAAAADRLLSEARDLPPATAEELEPSPDPVSALRQLAIAAEPDFVAEALPEPLVPPKRKLKRKESEPKPAPSKPATSKPSPSKPAPSKRAAPSWPPTLPSNEPDWDDSLETKG
jgi:hypothetical protein